MKVVAAKTAGFCFGVKKAVDRVYEESKKENVYTYGPIIHNEEVIADLERQGVNIIHTPQELEALTVGTVVIRSHGVAKSVYDLIEKKGLELVDCTCPFVLKIHRIVAEESKKGHKIIIIGDPKHPEVIGIKGWSSTEPEIISSTLDAENIDLQLEDRIAIVAQTTFNYKKFKELVDILLKKGYDINVFNTICNATEVRQQEAIAISREVDAMVVIGGKNSSNTQKLYEISKKECENTYYIQTLVDLDGTSFPKTIRSVGITAGASTPNNIIKEVIQHVRDEF